MYQSDQDKKELEERAKRETEEMRAVFRRIKEKQMEAEYNTNKAWEAELRKRGVEPYKHSPYLPSGFHGNGDAPGTMDNGTATFFWVISLIVGAIFKGNWVIWIISTAIWLKHITRHLK